MIFRYVNPQNMSKGLRAFNTVFPKRNNLITINKNGFSESSAKE